MKKTIIISLSVLVTILGVLVIIPFFFKTKLVETLQAEANKNLNATLKFNPDIGLNLFSNFPNLTLTIHQLSLVGKNEFEKDTLIKWETFEATINLMSVIRGTQIDIHKIYFKQANINAIVLQNGKANWDITKPSIDTTTQAAAEESKFKLKLKKLELEACNLSYVDYVLHSENHLQNMNLELAGDFTESNFELDIKSAIEKLTVKYGGIPYLNKVNANLQAKLNANMNEFKFTFIENEFSLNKLKFYFDGFVAMPDSNIDLDLKFAAKESGIKEFISLIPAIYANQFNEINTKGNFSFNGFAKGRYNSTQLPAFDLNLMVNNGEIKYQALPDAIKDLTIDLNIKNNNGQLNSTLVNLKKFHLLMGGDVVDAKLLASNLMVDPTIDGWLKGQLNLANINRFIPMPDVKELSGIFTSNVVFKGKLSSIEKEQYQNFEAAGQMALNQFKYQDATTPHAIGISRMLLNFSPKEIELAEFQGKAANSDVSLTGRLTNYLPYFLSNQKLQGNLNLNSTQINANEFLETETTQSTSTTADTAALTAPVIPNNVDFVFNSNIKQLKYATYNISNFIGKLKVQNASLIFDEISFLLLGANMKMNGFYETSIPTKPGLKMFLDIKNLDIQESFKAFNTVKKLAPIAEKMQGKFSTQLTLNTPLDKHLNPDYEKLYAIGFLEIPEASIQNITWLDNLSTILKNDKIKKAQLNQVKVEFEVKEGKILNKPFDLTIADKKMKVEGFTSLDQTIAYTGLVNINKQDLMGLDDALNKLQTEVNKQLNSNITRKETYPLQVKVAGPYATPKVTTNLQNLIADELTSMKDQAKQALINQGKKLEQQGKAELEKQKAELERKAQAEKEKLQQQADEAKKAAQAEIEKQKKIAAEKAATEKEKLKKKAEEEAQKLLKGVFKK